jgi:hypothetical protein
MTVYMLILFMLCIMNNVYSMNSDEKKRDQEREQEQKIQAKMQRLKEEWEKNMGSRAVRSKSMGAAQASSAITLLKKNDQPELQDCQEEHAESAGAGSHVVAPGRTSMVITGPFGVATRSVALAAKQRALQRRASPVRAASVGDDERLAAQDGIELGAVSGWGQLGCEGSDRELLKEQAGIAACVAQERERPRTPIVKLRKQESKLAIMQEIDQVPNSVAFAKKKAGKRALGNGGTSPNSNSSSS